MIHLHVLLFYSGKSYVSLTRELLHEGYDVVLSGHLVCQDAVEQYFGRHRDATGGNSNPTSDEFINNTLLFSVVNQASTAVRNGNTSTDKRHVQWTVDSTPLPRKKRC